ncbi:type II secretion system F family protein [Testudinibacter sp. P80/BLE/0925]|uniref:type II secretion system F family protein n=1 Tax=Testudinibacter sp. TW-1 TaxID=3417757 RepID=UPI003D36C22A
MIPFVAFYLALIAFGIVVLVMAFFAKRNFSKNMQILVQDSYPLSQENKKKKKEPKKSQKQLEVEQIIAANHTLIHFLFTLDKNVKVKFGLIFIILAGYYVFSDNKRLEDMMIPAVLIMIFFVIFPAMLGGMLIKGRLKKMMEDFPGFIDLVAVNLQVGLSIEASIKYVANDFSTLNKDLAAVLLRMIRKADVTGLESGLVELAQSLPTQEVKMFCTVLQQSLNFGSSIYAHLIQLSADLREMQLLVIEEKLGTLSAKMSIPLIIFIMVPIIILIVAPGFMRVFPSVL